MTTKETIQSLIKDINDFTKRAKSEDEQADLTTNIQDLKDKSVWIEIHNKQQLIEFSNLVNGINTEKPRPFLNAKLMNNIYFNDYWASGNPFGTEHFNYSIGKKETPYSGIFDGQGFTIFNLNTNINFQAQITEAGKEEETEYYLGLFGAIKNATIKNLIVNGKFIFRSRHAKKTHIGGMCGLAENSSFNNCFSEVNIYGTSNSSSSSIHNVGGIIGYTSEKINMFQCGYSGNMDIPGENMGSLIGYMSDSYEQSKIEECYNKGNIVGFKNVGGLIGRVGVCLNNPSENGESVKIQWSPHIQEDEELSNEWDKFSITSDIDTIRKAPEKYDKNFWNKHYEKFGWCFEYSDNNKNNKLILNTSNAEFGEEGKKQQWTICYIPLKNSIYPDSGSSYYSPLDEDALYIKINIETEGWYSFISKLFFQNSYGTPGTNTNKYTGGYYGGGQIDLYINDVLLWEEKSFNIPNSSAAAYQNENEKKYNFDVYLKQGENIIKIKNHPKKQINNATGAVSYQTSRQSIFIQSLEFIKLAEVPIDKTCKIYLGTSKELIENFAEYDILDIIEEFPHWDKVEIKIIETIENEYEYYLYIKNNYSENSCYTINWTWNDEQKHFYFISKKPNNLIKTNLIYNCYNNGFFDSYNQYQKNDKTLKNEYIKELGQSYYKLNSEIYNSHYAGGLFGVLFKNNNYRNYCDIWFENCVMAATTGVQQNDSDNSYVDNAIFSSMSEILSGCFKNVFYLNDYDYANDSIAEDKRISNNINEDKILKRIITVNDQATLSDVLIQTTQARELKLIDELKDYYEFDKITARPLLKYQMITPYFIEDYLDPEKFISLGSYPILKFEYDINKANFEFLQGPNLNKNIYTNLDFLRNFQNEEYSFSNTIFKNINMITGEQPNIIQTSIEDYSNFYYYRYLVQQGQKDCMVVLMNQLEEMFKLYNIK